METDIPVEDRFPVEFGKLTIFPLLKRENEMILAGKTWGTEGQLTSKEAASSFRYLGSGKAYPRIFMQGQANRI